MTAQRTIRRHGVVGVAYRDNRYLVIRRSQFVAAPRAYCFPGGGIEAGETEHQALVREMQEEMGAKVLQAEKLWDSVTSWSVALAWWRIDFGDQTLVADPKEVESHAWMTRDEIMQLDNLLSSMHDFFAAHGRGDFTL